MALNKEIITLFSEYARALGHPVTSRGKPFTVPRDRRGIEAVYFRVANIPARPDNFALSNTDSNIFTGIFQIDVMIPQGMEEGAAQDVIDMVCNKFGRGTRLGSVHVERPPYPGPESQETPYRVFPVSVTWVSYR